MKIGIITYHRACNYGAYLQAFALCSRLNQEDDFETEIIDFHMPEEKIFYSVAKHSLPSIIKKLIKRTIIFEHVVYNTLKKAQTDNILKKTHDYMLSNSLDDFKDFVYGRYDVIIAGSDEIWKMDSFRGFPTPYWLIGDLGCRKFSYAASSRVKFSILDENKREILKNALKDFEYIGVRDKYTYEEVTKVLQSSKKVHLCCDPTFLYDFDVKEKIELKNILKGKTRNDKKSILIMTEDRNVAYKIRKELNKSYNLISVYHKHKGYINLASLLPFEWLGLIKSVDFVITSYFHATCFSIILNTPFISIGTPLKSSKLKELFCIREMENYYMEKNDFMRQDLNSMMDNNLKVVDFRWYVLEQRKGFELFLNELRRNNSIGEQL